MINSKNWLTPEWPVPGNVFAVTTLRTGGFSEGGYQSLNPALHVGDNPEVVMRNRARISELLDLPAEPVWLQQVHGNTVIDAAQADGLSAADASFTNQAGVVCAVLTADCLPVLLCSRDGLSVAAVHAGWRGLLDGVITNTVNVLHGKDLLVWLGPAIGSAAFEVGAEVRSAFLAKSIRFGAAFTESHDGKWLADIYALARIDLASVGINQVYGGGFCTVTDADRFYSFRRDKQTGRMASLIWRA
ncbi:peptidoglycan editing factor PgeF [Methylicorpusculum oleiharenae]|uniref:peptidoglycan editing factor PgeF n=1 Tax=Methylicorpusculum oleiharenae TaxID=1338687 RepID=UPI00135A418A|nr:peptidoglycan editing factor PgeF [Methylicorpusculum oleiharenae]MCD2450261.1 peptidoglycan editing factor PgeF [Methylicorpusculum oleiharenae]